MHYYFLINVQFQVFKSSRLFLQKSLVPLFYRKFYLKCPVLLCLVGVFCVFVCRYMPVAKFC